MRVFCAPTLFSLIELVQYGCLEYLSDSTLKPFFSYSEKFHKEVLLFFVITIVVGAGFEKLILSVSRVINL